MTEQDFKFIKTFAQYMERNAAMIQGDLKLDFKSKGKKFLLILKRELQITNCDILYNPGGISVSGDHTLHSENLYINFNSEIAHVGLMFRSCKSKKDYTGGHNNWLHWAQISLDPNLLITRLINVK